MIIIIFGILWWHFTPVGEFKYDKDHPHINKKLIFSEPMIKVSNLKDYDRSDFSDKYQNYIWRTEKLEWANQVTNKTNIEYVKYNESFLIKDFFRFKRRGTGFTSDTNSTYYVLEDINKKIFILNLQFYSTYNMDYKYIIKD